MSDNLRWPRGLFPITHNPTPITVFFVLLLLTAFGSLPRFRLFRSDGFRSPPLVEVDQGRFFVVWATSAWASSARRPLHRGERT
jgi:hypothetical protein